MGELLVDQGAIDGDLLASVLLSVVYDPLIRLFREGDGAFEFEADTVHWIGPHRTFNVDAIVNEVRRRVREVDEMSPFVPSTDAWVSAERSLPGDAVQVTLLREDWELIAALAGPRTIAELAMEMGRGRYSTARVVCRLARTGLVSVLADPSSDPPPPPAPAAEAGDDTEDEDLSGDVWSGVTSDQRVTVPDTRTSGDSGAAVQPGGGLSTTGWSLPRRQPVALQEEPVHRPEWRTPWPRRRTSRPTIRRPPAPSRASRPSVGSGTR